jgi:predicted nucleic acid-binding protein
MSFEGAVTVIFDTDILVWSQRHHLKAKELIIKDAERCISVQTYMEFLQGGRSFKEARLFKNLLAEAEVTIIPLSERIGHRASIYIEEYAALSGLRLGDALIAATAVEHNLTLATGNKKHFQVICGLKIHAFHS